jgi:hypothetical protein
VIPEDLPVDDLVNSLGVVTIQALGETTYLAADRFTHSSAPAEPVIFRVSERFTKWFGSMTIESRQSSTLTRFHLTRRANNPSIIKALGGEDRCLTKLSDILLLLEQQPNCEEGRFLSTHYSNVFYVLDKDDEIRVVSVYADSDGRGWCIMANEISEGNWNCWQRVLASNC